MHIRQDHLYAHAILELYLVSWFSACIVRCNDNRDMIPVIPLLHEEQGLPVAWLDQQCLAMQPENGPRREQRHPAEPFAKGDHVSTVGYNRLRSGRSRTRRLPGTTTQQARQAFAGLRDHMPGI